MGEGEQKGYRSKRKYCTRKEKREREKNTKTLNISSTEEECFLQEMPLGKHKDFAVRGHTGHLKFELRPTSVMAVPLPKEKEAAQLKVTYGQGETENIHQLEGVGEKRHLLQSVQQPIKADLFPLPQALSDPRKI